MQESIVFLLRVQCRRKESSRSLSHLLMSFLLLSLIDPVYSFCVALPLGEFHQGGQGFGTSQYP